ncbi:CocE/NonD family hydrolase [Frigidibacter sp. SD6-1]|uniref:CocE/NonD family hydrolase n=1 Tax=Frigidibacter sp. SD6-1 TaxID=3032581 RepID=UPI0024E01AFC|nr:CocE/NonD family hydrolase [Frigidibacter sp. SD6-1]
MKVRTDFPRKVAETADMGIVLQDGTRLSARVWMPEDAADDPVPAILEYIPYRKRDGTLARDELMHPYFAGHGYAAVRVDIRGNGDSDGLMEDEYSEQELADACQIIDWLSRQPWCSGAVGMMGKSWGGFNCLQTAFLQPPALKAVLSVCSTTDRFADDIHFKGGCLLGENFGWGMVMLSYSSRPPDPALRSDWREEWLKRLEAEPFLTPLWASHQARDDYWKHGSVCEDYSRMTVPVMVVGGWADNYMNTVAALCENVPAPVQGLVGPWVHQYAHQAVPGPAIGFLQVALRWWDRWLKDIGNGAEADGAYRTWMLHSAPPDACARYRPGHWLVETDWPSPRVRREVLGLAPGRLGTAAALDMHVATPQHLGMRAGKFFPMGLNAEMAGDQREDDAASVCFDGAVLDAPLDLMGAARLRLTLSADRPRANLIARLCDVAPDGSSVRIAHGMLNLCHRHDPGAPVPMVPGKAEEVTLDLDQMAYRLLPGHRLRLALSTTYWPFVWPAAEVATLTLSAGSLELPVHAGGTGDEWQPPEPESARPWNHRTLREARATRRIERDLTNGRQALVVEEDGGERENLDHGLISGETMSERWEIDPEDPLSARATIRWEQRLRRGDWNVRTEATGEMTATADALVTRARLTAWEGETIVFQRDYEDRVPRVHL